MSNTLTRVSPIQSKKITLTETVEKETPYFADGLHGFVMEDGDSGDEVTMDVSARTWEMNLGELSLGNGDSIYIDETGTLTDDNTDRWFGTLLSDKDSNNVAEVLIAPQSDSQAA